MIRGALFFFVVLVILGTSKKTMLYREGKVYLIRYTLIKTKEFSLKVHKTIMSDPADLHDHPWNYYSFILWGGYYEETSVVVGQRKSFNVNTGKHETAPIHKLRWYGPGSLLKRNGANPHRLIIPAGKSCITVILTTKKWRNWGFLKNGKWVCHKEASY